MAGRPVDAAARASRSTAWSCSPGRAPGGPTVYFGGESEPARALAARAADVFFINGRPLDHTVELIDDLRRRPRRLAPLRFGLSAFVIARPDEDEALAELEPCRS